MDVLILDTAGRLHTKDQPHGRDEEIKSSVVTKKVKGAAPHERCWCSTPPTARTPSRRPKLHEALGRDRHHHHQARRHGQGRLCPAHRARLKIPYGTSAWAKKWTTLCRSARESSPKAWWACRRRGPLGTEENNHTRRISGSYRDGPRLFVQSGHHGPRCSAGMDRCGGRRHGRPRTPASCGAGDAFPGGQHLEDVHRSRRFEAGRGWKARARRPGRQMAGPGVYRPHGWRRSDHAAPPSGPS